jgi:uncharacterized membrane protein YbaN (DUF454 family)
MSPRIRKLLRSALLLCLVLTCSAAQAGIEEHMQAIGSTADRALGAAGETLAADYVQSVFAGLPRELHAVTGRQQFTTPVRKFTSASLSMDGRQIPLHPFYANALSPETVPPEGLSGELVYVGEGRLEDFDGKRIAGKIVLMNLDSGRGWQNAANLGARALVYLDRGDTAAPRLRFRDKEELTPVDFPRYWVPFDKFESLIAPVEEIKGHAARLEGRTEWAKHVASNVYCFIPGQNPQRASELLLVEAFLDASRYVPQHAPGADEGTSLATLLQLAHDFAAAPPERSILLLASTGRGNNLAGMREAVWALSSKKKDLTEELGEIRERGQAAQMTVELLNKGELATQNAEHDKLILQAIQTELRNEIEGINTALRLARKDAKANAARIKELAQKKLLLRRVGWEPAYDALDAEALEAVRQVVPLALTRAKRIEADIAERVEILESALRMNALAEGRRMAAAVSLHLSSHGNAVGSVGDGWMFKLIPTLNRAKQYTHIRPVLNAAAKGHSLAYDDLLGGTGRQQWFNHFPDQPAMGGELTALAAMPGFTLATLNDMRSVWGTPYDTLDRVDMERVRVQADLVTTMLRALDRAELPNAPYKAVSGFSTLSGRANFLRQGELFPEQKAENALLQVYQDQQFSLTWVDSLGEFRLPGLANKKNSFGKAIIEGYRFEPGANSASWAIDKPATGKDRYRVKLNRDKAETDLIMFGCTQTTLFQLRDARSLNHLTRISLIDARTETNPLRYWYSRIDTRESTLCSLFLEPETPVKVTLSDTVLQRKLLLLGNSEDDMLGQGYLASATPAILNTSIQAAQDMMHLVVPRVENLEEHSIINQRIRVLLQQGQDHLRQSLEARDALNHSAADQHARASLSVIARVYNDVERTQKDVLGGVLFYIALFVPFAYCLERLFFAYVSIHKRIAAFLGLLAVVIGIIYNVHPAFELTYSPMVVVLAFFILGLSVLVSLILFTRFEQEMKNLQRRARITRDQSISLWGAFVAAFSIGVTNLRRRKVRTALTCTTLVILTYTLLNFTSVRHSLDQGATRYTSHAPYQGVMLKALEWKSLPMGLGTEILATHPDSQLLTRRVWWETQDRTRPPAITVTFEDKLAVASGMIGLDAEEIRLAARGTELLAGAWLDGAEAHQVLLSEKTAAELGIRTLDETTRVLIWGIPFRVQGIFQGQAHDQSLDLDGEPLTPVVYPNETSSELSEAEAEAAESGQDIASMSSRYQHVGGDQTLIIPAQTLLQMGGSLKSLALVPGTQLHHGNISAQLADRYQLLLFHGSGDNTWLHYSSSALSYSGMGNVLIPSVIAILIVLNTMVGSVIERKREIAVYTSVGLAPPHVSSLFIAEALAFGVISAVTGYLAAQIASHFLAGTALWAGMTANYSSLAGVGAMLMVMAVVLLSVIYPSRVASRIAIPDVTRTWNLPKTDGMTMVVTLPFLIKFHEQDCAGGFLAEYYQAHADISHGLFSTDELDVEYACPLDAPNKEHPDCFNIFFRAWLAPFDFGIRQRVHIMSCPSPDYPKFLEMRITLTREAGEKNAWQRLCRSFLNDLRKQLLIWRSLDSTDKELFATSMQTRLSAKQGART